VLENIVVSVRSISKSNTSFQAGFIVVLDNQSPAVILESRNASVVSVALIFTLSLLPLRLAS
jgi:hypothetical protein